MGSAHRLLRKHPIMFAFGEGVRIPFYLFKQKNNRHPKGYLLFYGGEQGIRTLETVLAVYTISNRAPSTSSDNSPFGQRIYILNSALLISALILYIIDLKKSRGYLYFFIFVYSYCILSVFMVLFYSIIISERGNINEIQAISQKP